MLRSRILKLKAYVNDARDGKLNANPEVLRRISAIVDWPGPVGNQLEQDRMRVGALSGMYDLLSSFQQLQEV